MAAPNHLEPRWHAAMLAQASDAIVLISPENRVLGAAGATLSIFGLPAQEMVGHSFSQFVPRPHRRDYRSRLRRGLRLPIEESRITLELQMQHADGRILDCDANGATLVEDGRRVGRLLLLRDATTRRKVEAALRASEARLKQESERLLALHEASSLLAAQTADADEVLDQVLRSAVNLLGGGSGSLYRWDAAAGLLRCVRNWQVPARDVTPDVRPGEGLAGHTFLSDEPVIVNDYATWDLGMHTGRVGGMRAGLGVPLIRHGVCLGVLLVRVYQHDLPRPFDVDDARLATLFGDQVAAALLTADAFEQQRYAVLHDSLTGLPNRVLLVDRVQQAILAARREGTSLAVMAMDLDRFKDVNDTLGHAAGDTLLREVGRRLVSALRGSDTVARMGGDEFAVLLPGTNPEGAARAARALIAAIEHPFDPDGQVVEVGLSIGTAFFPEHGQDADTLLRHADLAMYVAKRANAGCVGYAPEHSEQNRDRITRLSELRRAIDGGELVLHYQPKIDCRQRRVTGVEALVRWQHPEHGLMAPDLFIPLAEQSGLIKQLTHHVLAAAIRQSGTWRAMGLALPMSVNVSMRDLHDPRLPEVIGDLLASEGVPRGDLELEITETALMADADAALEVLRQLRTLGLQIAVDDFRTGYSSLTYLKQLPVDSLKIDKSFVCQLATDPSDLAIVRSIVELGHNLGLRVVAEGVEDATSWERLVEHGCDSAQGNYLSRPVPPHQFETWLRTSQWGLGGSQRCAVQTLAFGRV